MIRDYYSKSNKWYDHDERLELKVGRVGWAPILFTPAETELKKLEFDKNGTVIGTQDVNRSNSFNNSHDPFVTPFRLETNEEVLCIKAKKRPVLLLTQADPGIKKIISNSRQLDRDLRLGKVWLILPIRSYKDDHLQELVESLYLPVFFPMIGNKACPKNHGYVRFDKVQPIHQTLIEPSHYTMSEECLNILKEAYISYTTNKQYGDTYPYLRDLFMESLKEAKIII